MEVVRKYVDAKELRSVVSLPETFIGRKLEIIILPAEEKEEKSKKGSQIISAVDALVGIIPDDGKDLQEYRAERLRKYEIAD